MRQRLDRSERAQRVARADRALDAQHHDAAVTFGENRMATPFRQGIHEADLGPAPDAGADFDAGDKKSVVRRGMMDLQMRFVDIAGRAQKLRAELRRALGTNAAERPEQVVQPAIQCAQVARVDLARAATLDVDRGDFAVVCGAQGAARQEGSRPTPKRIEAGRHCALRAVNGRLVADESGPRQQFVSPTRTVQVHVVRGLGEHLGVEKMREPLGDTAPGFSGKRAGEIDVVGGRRPEAGVVSRLVQDGDHHHRAAQRRRAPVFGPVAQQRGPLVFVAVGGPIEHQHGTVATAPDKQIEADAARGNSTLVKAGRQALKIDGKFGRG